MESNIGAQEGQLPTQALKGQLHYTITDQQVKVSKVYLEASLDLVKNLHQNG